MRSGATSSSAYHRPAGKIRIVVRSADLPRPSRPPFASAAVWTAAIGAAARRLELLPDVDALLVAGRVHGALEVLHRLVGREECLVGQDLGVDVLLGLVVGRPVAVEVRLLGLDLGL